MKEFNTTQQIELHQKAIEHLRDIEILQSMIDENEKAADKYEKLGLMGVVDARKEANIENSEELIEAAFAYKTIVEQLISNI